MMGSGTNSSTLQRLSRNKTLERATPPNHLALEGPWKARLRLTSTKTTTCTMTIDRLAVYFYKSRLGRYRLGHIDAHLIPGSHREKPSSNCIESVAKVSKTRNNVTAAGSANALWSRGHHTSSHQGPALRIPLVQVVGNWRSMSALTSSMNAVTTLRRGNLVANVVIPSGLAIRLRKRIRSSGTPRLLRTSTAIVAEPPFSRLLAMGGTSGTGSTSLW